MNKEKIVTCENCGGAIYTLKEDACYIKDIPFPICPDCYWSYLNGEESVSGELW
jgi:hypothetical protein